MQERRSDNEIRVGRKTRGSRGFGSHSLCKTTEPILAGDPIAGTEALNLFAAGDDHPGGVRSRHVRQGRSHLVTAADHQIIHVADRRGMDFDQNFVWRRVRFGRFTNGQCLNAVESVAKHRAQSSLRDLTRMRL
jgi:hypothetical protein